MIFNNTLKYINSSNNINIQELKVIIDNDNKNNDEKGINIDKVIPIKQIRIQPRELTTTIAARQIRPVDEGMATSRERNSRSANQRMDNRFSLPDMLNSSTRPPRPSTRRQR